MESEADHRSALKMYTRLMRCAEAVTRQMHAHLKGHHLTISQFGVLEALFHLGPLHQKDIGRKILKSRGNITLVIDNLEKRGLVIRRVSESDRRYTQVMLTDEGAHLINALFPIHAQVAGDTFSILSEDEKELLGRLLKKLGMHAARLAHATDGD